MRKFIVLLLFIFILCNFQAENYQFLALGDIHYLAEEYYKKLPKKPKASKKRQVRFDMWKSGKSEALIAESAKIADSKMTFVVQLGDLSEGGTYRQDLQEKMLAVGFEKVKKYFSETPLTAIRGNHDSFKKAVSGSLPWIKIILPLMSKELGEDVTSVNYARKIGKDLYIYYDGQTPAHKGIAFVKKVFEENKEIRHCFFFSHLPLIPVAATRMAWRANGAKELIEILSKHNAIILTAHVHHQSYVVMNTAYGKIYQFSVNSVGSQWNPAGKVTVRFNNVEDFLNNPRKIESGATSLAAVAEEMKNYTFDEFSIYKSGSGFAIIKVDDREVKINFYSNYSGEPKITKTIRN